MTSRSVVLFAFCAVAVCFEARPQSLRDAAELDAEGKCEQAEQLYQAALARDPRSTAVLNNAGNHYLLCGDSGKAEQLFQKLLRINPRHGNANVQLARLAAERKEGEKALEYLTHVSATGPELSLIRAEALHWTGRKSASSAILNEVAKTSAADPDVLYLLGVTCARMGLYERAETAFSQALALRPGDFDLTFGLGRAAARAQHYERAQRALETALAMRPEATDVLVELARVYAARQEYSRAVFNLARARQKDPANAEVALLLARAAEDGGYFEDAAAAYDDYLRMRPDDDPARRDRARACGETESRRHQARREIAWYLAKHPDDPLGHYVYAQIFWADEPEQALGHLTEAVHLAPDSASFRFSRAWMLQRLGRMAESLPDLDAANRLTPGHVRILDLIGLAHLSLDQPAKAEKVFRQAIAQAPDDPQVVLHIGRALMDQGRELDAQQFLDKYQKIRPRELPGIRKRSGMVELATFTPTEQRAHQIDWYRKQTGVRPDRPDYQLRLAEVLLADGQIAAAIQEFRRLLELNASPALSEEAGDVLLRAREYSLASEFLRRALDRRSGARVNLCIAALHERGPEAALALLRQVRSGQPTGEEMLLEANLLELAGRPDEAIQVLNQSLNRATVRASVAQRVASSLVRLRRPDDALRLLDRAMADSPEDLDLPLSKGIILSLTGQAAAAEKTFRQLQRRWPEWWKAYLADGLLLERLNRRSEARQKLETAKALAPDEAGPRCALRRVDTNGRLSADCSCGTELQDLLLDACSTR